MEGRALLWGLWMRSRGTSTNGLCRWVKHIYIVKYVVVNQELISEIRCSRNKRQIAAVAAVAAAAAGVGTPLFRVLGASDGVA